MLRKSRDERKLPGYDEMQNNHGLVGVKQHSNECFSHCSCEQRQV